MHIPEYYEFFNKCKISSGNKALENIPFDLKSMNAAKPLVVTDARSVKRGCDKILKKSFDDSGMIIGAIHDGAGVYSSAAIVKNMASLYRDRGCDSIIALGGPSAAAVAKGANILVSNKSDHLLDFEDMSKSLQLRPFIYIPTSDAAGTESSSEAVIDSRVFKSSDLMPDIIVIDPRMITKNDIQYTVNSGLLGLVQSIESCNLAVSNPLNDSFSFAAIELISRNMHAAAGSGCKKSERTAFISGVVISAISYSNAPEGLARAIGYETEKLTGNPAGLCAGLVLPYLLEYQINNIKDGVREELFLPLGGIEKYCSVSEKERPRAGVAALFSLIEKLDDRIPKNLKMLNIPEYIIEKIAAAAEERTGKLYPKGTALKVLKNAYHGKKSAGGK